MARRRKSRGALGRAARWLVVIVTLAIIAGVTFFALHDGAWHHFRVDLFRRQSSRATAASACGEPLPQFPGGALAASRAAPFATIEQLKTMSSGVYRVQARLLSVSTDGSQIRLHLGSLVHPALDLDAFIPPQACGASQEDRALYDELREVVGLRFGPLQARLTPPTQPTEVVATGALVRSSGGLELRPLLDLHVQ